MNRAYELGPTNGLHQVEDGNNADGHGNNYQNPLDVDNKDNDQWSLDEELRQSFANAQHDRGIYLQDYARSPEKFGIFSTTCMLINFTIGAGIFETPKSVWLGTGTVSAALFMWCIGSLTAFAGLLVYLELGLTIPRYRVRGKWRSVPRSGGEKNYVGSQKS